MQNERSASTHAETPQIPMSRASDMKRRFSLHPFQMIAVPLMLLVPVLTLFGLLGDTSDRIESREGGIVLRVEYPTRTHYETHSRVIVSARNESAQPLTDVTVVFERAYLDSFSDFNFVPDVSIIDATAYYVPIGDMPAGTERLVTLDFTARQQGTISGGISLASGGARVTGVSLSTFVFP